MRSVRVVGLGGSLREMSTSRTALQVALEGAAASGADVELIWVRDLGLPLYTDEHAPPPGAHRLAETVYQADALIWSSPTYHGSVSGSFKNALDWLILLAENEPPYLSNKPIGLVTTAAACRGCKRSTRWTSSPGRCAAGACRWCCRWPSRGSRSTRTGISRTRRSPPSCASSAPRLSAPPGNSRPRAPATTPRAPISGLKWGWPWMRSKAAEYR